MEEAIEHFQKVVFPLFQKTKKKYLYPKEQMSFIMDTFKGQDNKILKKLCAKKICKVVIVPSSLTNSFQSLDIYVNKAAKSFISEKKNTWMVNEVSNQRKRGLSPSDVKLLSS